jgi:leucyl/phenylalanyl-tRNA---protein transferase
VDARHLPQSAWDLPDPALAPPGEDLIAVGADLEPGTLAAAYARGLFPMDVGGDGPLGWWSPDPRGVLPLDGLRVSRSLRASARRMTTTVDACFDDVMSGCADQRRSDGWITPAFRDAYSQLHELGIAHSVEVWSEGVLVGGLYGIEIGGLFAGESMFHRVSDASKVALIALVEALGGGSAATQGRLLDVQWATPHLESLGVIAIPRRDYLDRLRGALRLDPIVRGSSEPRG